MFHPGFSQFKRLAKKGNLLPVYKEILADMETPVSAFTKVGMGKYAYLLESVEGGEKLGRYSFLSSSPALIFESKGKKVTLSLKTSVMRQVKETENPLEELRKIMQKYKPVEVEGLPRFYGGAVGYIGYDMVKFIEDIPSANPDDLDLPDCKFIFTDNLLIFDHVAHTIKVVSCVHLDKEKINLKSLYNEACRKIERLITELRKKPRKRPKTKRPGSSKIVLQSNFTRNGFERIVAKAKEYIRRGDIIQTVLSQRLETKVSAHPFDIYRALRIINPSPYMYYLSLGGMNIVGSSPEILVRQEGKTVEVRPIAGTRPRGKDELEDKKLERELLKSSKEKAEHLMLVDLGRNDIGRVCEYGSVKVPELMVIERYSHVMHIVSGVIGKLRRGMDSFDVLRACFPAGTVSGAPKVRAMEIIEELENLRRGPYAGAVGYFSFQGNMDMAITIRTILIKGKRAFLQAGAGIVADSIPRNEYEETLNKAKALFEAIEMAEKGFE
ncbi:MAG: anthranilate synthase component I [Elusimicrobiota bacterium]|nr:anthranilate synthase component I [Elusimicrobiota bacterium]